MRRVRPVADWTAITHALLARCGGRCEACGMELRAEGVRHHRRLRSQGGGHTLDNLLLLHDRCHRDVHANPATSYQRGMLVPSWAAPSEWPWANPRTGRMFLLDADGERHALPRRGMS